MAKNKKTQITMSIDPALVKTLDAKVEAASKKAGIELSRSAYLCQLISRDAASK